jgi:hypothetical protein
MVQGPREGAGGERGPEPAEARADTGQKREAAERSGAMVGEGSDAAR